MPPDVRPGQLSPDRRWYWDGAKWITVYSADRRWWWDGAAWRATSRSAPRSVAPIAIVVVVALVFGGVWVSFFGWPGSHAQRCASTYHHGSSLPPPAVGFDVPLPFTPATMTTDGCDWSVVWLVSRREQALWRYQRDVGSVEGPFMLQGTPTAVVSDDRNTVWVALASGFVEAIDASTKRSVALIQVGNDPVSILYGGNEVWVTNQGSGSITRIDPRTKRVVGTISTGLSPSRLLVCCYGAMLVWKDGGGSVSVLDSQSLALLATWTFSAEPTAVVNESFLEPTAHLPAWVLLSDGTITEVETTHYSIVKSRQVEPAPVGGVGLVHALLVVSKNGTVWLIDDSPKKAFGGDHKVLNGGAAEVVGVAEGSGVKGNHITLWIADSKRNFLSFVIGT